MSIICCDSFKKSLDDEDIPLRYIPKYREFSIVILDGGSSSQEIHFCPWCGKKLPKSLRDLWFDTVWDKLNLDGPEDPRLPDEYKSEDWWIESGL